MNIHQAGTKWSLRSHVVQLLAAAIPNIYYFGRIPFSEKTTFRKGAGGPKSWSLHGHVVRPFAPAVQTGSYASGPCGQAFAAAFQIGFQAF